MPSYNELVEANAALRRVLASGAEAALRAIPGVRHISVGLKVRDRVVTKELCIRVYVREKRAEASLAPEERIPREIDGVATDVNVARSLSFAIDSTRYRPLKGGIMVSNSIVTMNRSRTRTQMAVGTFGCTATLTRDGSPVMLSNWHVLMANGAERGHPIYQPVSTFVPDFDPADLPVRIGRADDVIAHIVEGNITDKVDAAIARLDVSSCCRCCGLDYRDEILGLSDAAHPSWNEIVGTRPAVAGATVYKVGISSGRTVGSVVDIDTDDLQGSLNGVDFTLTGQIEIASADAEDPFSVEGDSGSVIVDEDNYVVGLLFGSAGDSAPDARTYANHIADVCSEMGITINITTGLSDTAGARVSVPRVAFAGAPTERAADRYAGTRERVLAHPGGAWLWALAEQHREEIVSLVTTCRPATVAWHRAGGPALVASGLATMRAGGDALPLPREGTLEDALAKVADALHAQGSAELRTALGQHRHTLLASVRESATLDDVLDKLAPATGAGFHSAPSLVTVRGDPA